MYQYLLYIENEGLFLSPRPGGKDVLPFDFSSVKEKVIALVKLKGRSLDFIKEGKVTEILSQNLSILPAGQAQRVCDECFLLEMPKRLLSSAEKVASFLSVLKSYQAGHPEKLDEFIKESKASMSESTFDVETLGLGSSEKRTYKMKRLTVD